MSENNTEEGGARKIVIVEHNTRRENPGKNKNTVGEEEEGKGKLKDLAKLENESNQAKPEN